MAVDIFVVLVGRGRDAEGNGLWWLSDDNTASDVLRTTMKPDVFVDDNADDIAGVHASETGHH